MNISLKLTSFKIYFKMKLSYTILIFTLFFLLNCQNSKEIDTYKIYNTVLKEKVSTYGILASYLPYDKHYSDKEIENIAKKVSDSLQKAKTLTYFLDNEVTILDTINPSDEFSTGNDIIVEFKPKYSKNKIDFSKIKNLEIGKRLSESQKIDENKIGPTYLGSYELSEPVFISKEKAVIRYQHHCGSKCGLSILIYLKKEKEEWKIINKKLIFIS